jgi:hypothetical protein
MRGWRRRKGDHAGEAAADQSEGSAGRATGERSPQAETYEVRTLPEFAKKYGHQGPDEVAGSASGQFYLDYGPASILADSARAQPPPDPGAPPWSELDKDEP